MAETEAYGSAGVGFMGGDYKAYSQLHQPVTDMGFQISDMCYDAIHVRCLSAGSFKRAALAICQA